MAAALERHPEHVAVREALVATFAGDPNTGLWCTLGDYAGMARFTIPTRYSGRLYRDWDLDPVQSYVVPVPVFGVDAGLPGDVLERMMPASRAAACLTACDTLQTWCWLLANTCEAGLVDAMSACRDRQFVTDLRDVVAGRLELWNPPFWKFGVTGRWLVRALQYPQHWPSERASHVSDFMDYVTGKYPGRGRGLLPPEGWAELPMPDSELLGHREREEGEEGEEDEA